MSTNFESPIARVLRNFVAVSASLIVLLISRELLTTARKKRIRRRVKRWSRALEQLPLDTAEYEHAQRLVQFCQRQATDAPLMTAREVRRASLQAAEVIRERYGVTAPIQQPSTVVRADPQRAVGSNSSGNSSGPQQPNVVEDYLPEDIVDKLIDLLFATNRRAHWAKSKGKQRGLFILKDHLINASIDTMSPQRMEMSYQRTGAGQTLLSLTLRGRKSTKAFHMPLEKLSHRPRAKVFAKLGFPMWAARPSRPTSFQRTVSKNQLAKQCVDNSPCSVKQPGDSWHPASVTVR